MHRARSCRAWKGHPMTSTTKEQLIEFAGDEPEERIQIKAIVSEAMHRYLRVCSSGGMSKRRIDTVMASVEDAERLGYFDLAIAQAILADRARRESP